MSDGDATSFSGAMRVSNIMDVAQIPLDERKLLDKVIDQYSFRATDYYLGLIDWSDPDDPIRRLIIPHVGELDEWGELDASNEASITRIHGVQHKYPDTVLLLVTDSCTSFCRYCFQKRLFKPENKEVNHDLTSGFEYIQKHKKITDVLLTGGDPLTLSTKRLDEIFSHIKRTPHIQTLRISSKTPAFNPWRLTNDIKLQESILDFTRSGKRLYLMTHFDHPREITDAVAREIGKFQELGVICVNQCPMIRGVNDNPLILKELYQRLTLLGISPYYLFQGRPTKGNSLYRVPIVKSYEIFREAIRNLSGLARRTRFVMSHSTGKVEIVGIDCNRIYARYHRASNPLDCERFMIFLRDDEACWLDDLEVADNVPELDSFCANDVRY